MESLVEKIAKLYSVKPSNLSAEEGRAHPIYEALAALLKDQVSDEDAEKRLLAEGEKGLKSVIIADGFLEFLKPQQREEIKRMLSSGRPLRDIIDKASLFNAEDKRSKDGMALYRADSKSSEIPLRKVLKRADYARVYIESEEIERLKKETKKMREVSKYKRIAAGILVGALLLGGLLSRHRIYNVYRINRDIEEAIHVVPEIREGMRELDKQYQAKKQEYDRLSKETERLKR